jgi:hypothetical protein
VEKEPDMTNESYGSNETPLTLTDRKALDDHLAPIGTVTDVIYDSEQAMEPRWAIVKTGKLGGERPAPLEGSYVADSGDLVLQFDRDTIKHAPKVPHDHVLTRRDEDEIAEYYDIQH